MPKKSNDDRVRRAVTYLPEDLFRRVEELAKKERRTLSTEILVLIEKGIAN